MNGKYEAAAIAVKNAEKALETLKDFAGMQYKAKGETMREQIADYIANTLADACYLKCGCLYGPLSLSCNRDFFAFGINYGTILQFTDVIFYIDFNGKIVYKDELSETNMLEIMENWEGFKQALDRSIKRSLKAKTEHINKEIAHIAYVNEQLSKWHV